MTKWLSRLENLAALADLPGQWIGKVHRWQPSKTVVLDMDSSESLTYGEQEGSAFNGHFALLSPAVRDHQFGDVERCAPRPGFVHSRWLARGAGAGDRQLPANSEAPLFPR